MYTLIIMCPNSVFHFPSVFFQLFLIFHKFYSFSLEVRGANLKPSPTNAYFWFKFACSGRLGSSAQGSLRQQLVLGGPLALPSCQAHRVCQVGYGFRLPTFSTLSWVNITTLLHLAYLLCHLLIILSLYYHHHNIRNCPRNFCTFVVHLVTSLNWSKRRCIKEMATHHIALVFRISSSKILKQSIIICSRVTKVSSEGNFNSDFCPVIFDSWWEFLFLERNLCRFVDGESACWVDTLALIFIFSC